MKKYLSVAWALLLILALAVGCVPTAAPEPLAGAADYNTACYTPQGGASFTCDSGGSVAVNSGASLLIASGATETHGNTATFNGILALGDGGDIITVNSSDWDISATGDMTNIGAITSNGLATLALGATVSGATTSINASSNFGTNINTGTSSGALALGGNSGTVAIDSSDWDINTTGDMTGIGAITSNGLATLALGATVSGATTSINASSNFGTNINTGTSSGALALGGNSGTVAIDSSAWDISTAGAVSSIGDITAITALAGGWDLGIATAAAATAGGTLDITGQAGGTAGVGADGQAGGALTVTGGAGTALDGAGTNDGSGGDVALLGGAKGGATGTAVDGIVRVGSPTVGSTKTTNLLAVAGGLEVDGAARFDGAVTANSTLDVVGATTVEALSTGVDATGAAVYHYSNTAGDWMFYDPAGPTLNVIGSNAVTALNVSDGNAIVNDNLTVTTGAFAVTAGTTTLGGATIAAADVTVSADTTGGNALAVNQFIGVPRIDLRGIGTMANGTTNTVIVDIGDSETPATDWTAIDADTVMSNDSSFYRQGTASLKMAVATTADATDGATNTLATGNQNWTDDESVGMWLYSTVGLTAGDLVFIVTDSVAADTSTNIPAVVANTWTWVEVDISGIANASKDVLTDVSIELSAAGAAVALGAAFDVYIDFVVKWDGAEEESLGRAILQDGVMSVVVVDATTTGAGSVNLVEYTDYFVHYQASTDAIVMMTDQSGADKVGLVLVAY